MWQATAMGVTKNQTLLSVLTHPHTSHRWQGGYSLQDRSRAGPCARRAPGGPRPLCHCCPQCGENQARAPSGSLRSTSASLLLHIHAAGQKPESRALAAAGSRLAGLPCCGCQGPRSQVLVDRQVTLVTGFCSPGGVWLGINIASYSL